MAFRTSYTIEQSDTAKTPHGSVTIGTSSAQVVPANSARVGVYICNDHATNTLYLSLGGTAVANQGIRLNAAGGTAFIQEYSGVINGIASGASTVVCFSEV